MQYYIISSIKFKKQSISILLILLAITANVKTQSILEVSPGATVSVTSGADICADTIIGIIQGEGTICGGVNSIDSETEIDIPKVFALDQNYPNPFNPTTIIQYSIPQRSNVTLKVYDVLGNEVVTLVNEEKDRGVYSINFDAPTLASGIYLYSLQSGSFVETKKLMFIK